MMHRIDQNRGATQHVKNVDPGQLLGYMMHHIMMQHISKKLTWIVEVDDAFHCDDGTMRLFLAILSPIGGAGAVKSRVWGANSKFSRFFEGIPPKVQ